MYVHIAIIRNMNSCMGVICKLFEECQSRNMNFGFLYALGKSVVNYGEGTHICHEAVVGQGERVAAAADVRNRVLAPKPLHDILQRRRLLLEELAHALKHVVRRHFGRCAIMVCNCIH